MDTFLEISIKKFTWNNLGYERSYEQEKVAEKMCRQTTKYLRE